MPLALAGAYLVATRRERDSARTVAFLAGCGLLGAALVTPLDTLARTYLVWAHLLQNVVLAEWAPLLLVVGVPPALAARLSRPAAVRVLTYPFVGLPLWVATYALWHVPALYDAALRRPETLLALEHLTYVVAAFVLSAPLGLVLALVPRAIYDSYADAPERVLGLSRLEDQQLGGMTMAAEQSVVFFCVFAYWFLRFLAEQDALEA